MTVYLSSFYPLCATKEGKIAYQKYGLKPFRDGSCRLEPDFEIEYPAITGLCRPGFAKKLKEGDIIIYATNKKGLGKKHLVAVLEVIKTAFSHTKAEEWYLNNKTQLPNNLMVNANKPFPIDHTHEIMGWGEVWGKKKTLKEWDDFYKDRANENPEVAICRKLYSELKNPHPIDDNIQLTLFQRIPLTRNPPILTPNQWASFNLWLNNINI